jgi:hypothetical protein
MGCIKAQVGEPAMESRIFRGHEVEVLETASVFEAPQYPQAFGCPETLSTINPVVQSHPSVCLSLGLRER